MSRSQLVAWEERWAMPTALATLGAVALLVASTLVGSSLGGEGEAETLRDLNDRASAVTLASVLQGAGFLLLMAPLVYLFRAAQGRVPRVRAQFLPLVILAPIALGTASVLNGVAASDAAEAFVNGEGTSSVTRAAATTDCRSERRDDRDAFQEDFGSGDAALDDCATTRIEDEKAEDAIEDASIRRVAEGIQFGGLLALAFGLVYGCLHAMRAGLLTRFWGSLGIAIGVASVLGLFQLGIIWFTYFGLLVAGWIPGGKPPAWASGEAMPWPTPAEKAAAELEAANDEPENPDAPEEATTPGPDRPEDPNDPTETGRPQ